MQGMGVKSLEQKRKFYRGLLLTGAATAAADVDAKADELSRRTRDIWLKDRSLAHELAAVRAAEREPPVAALSPAAQTEVTGAAPPFDPFAFSTVVVMTKQGRDGLMQRLAEIADADHLKQIAEAQHLAIDRRLTDADALREAILKGTEQRIADRRAAAS